MAERERNSVLKNKNYTRSYFGGGDDDLS